VLALLNTNTIGLSTRFHYPVDPICRAPDFTVDMSEAPRMAAIAGCPFLAKISSQQAPSQRECDKTSGGAIQRRRVSEAAVSEGVSAKRMSPKRVTAKRVTAKRMTPKRMTPKRMTPT
jgi:hypothetical protein